MTKRPGLATVYAIVFLAFFDTFALLPTVGPYAATLGAGAAGIGFAVGAYSASNIVFNLIGGILLDRVGRRPVIAAGLAIAVVGVACYMLVTTPQTLIVARLIHGAGGGLIMPALFTLAGDIARVGHRGAVMGRIGACIGLAAVVGPAVAGPLRAVAGFHAVFVTIAMVLLLALVMVGVRLAELPATPVVPADVAGDTARTPSRWRPLVLAVTAVFAFTSAFATLAGFLGLHVEPMTQNAAITGGLFALVSGIAAVIMVTPLARWVDQAGVAPPVMTGMVAFVAATAMLAATRGLAWTVVACVIFGVGFGVLFPAATGGVAASAGTARRGRAFGWFNAAYSLGFVIGAPVAGGLTEITGTSPFIAPAVVCSLVAIAAGWATMRFPENRARDLRVAYLTHPETEADHWDQAEAWDEA